MHLMDPPGGKCKDGVRKAEESDARRLSAAGVFVLLLLVRECAKVKGGHTAKRGDICGDPWKNRRTTSLWPKYTPAAKLVS